MIDHGPSANDAAFGSAYGSTQETAPRRLISLALAALIHIFVLYMVLFHKSPLEMKNKKGDENPIMYITGALTKSEADKPRPKAAEAPPKSVKPKVQPITQPPPVYTPPVVAQEPPPPPKPEVKQAPPEMDMSAMIEARRRQRAEARPEQGQAEESESERAMRIARANLANVGTRGRDNDAGGVFQIRRIGVSSGEFFFRGWNSARGRTAAQLIEVLVKPDEDVQVAIVRRMIEIIRAEKPGDFTWESHRLGREVQMSSRPADEPQLIRFLLAEFFPNYIPSRRG